MKRIAGKLGIEAVGNASDRSVRRIVKEGGAAQFVEAVRTSKGTFILISFHPTVLILSLLIFIGVTLSSDGN